MNVGLTLTVWLQLLGLLAVEIALVVIGAALISRFVASAAWQRTVWQVSLLAVLALTLSELTGMGRSAVGWLTLKARPEKPATARPAAANQSEEPPASGRMPEALRRKVGAQLGQENLQIAVETAEATSLVVPPSRADSQRVPATTNRPSKQDSPNGAEVGGDSITDSLAILRLGLIWLMGAGLVITRSCVAHVLFAWLRRHRRPVDDAELLRRVRALAQLLGIARRVHLVESSWLAGPIVFGVFRPVIGLPTGFAGRFSPVQQEAMLAHELAHMAAHDPIWYLVANWANAILWWHPLVWWARRRLHAASEMAADEASLVVVEGPVVLAECLAELGARLAQRRSFVWMGVEGNGLRSGLGQRVERLVRLRGNSLASQGCLRPALAKIFGPAALVATAMLSTAWVSPRAFSKGESMNTMEQVWKSSFTAFALLATPQEATGAALAVNGDGEEPSGNVARLLRDGRLLYEMGKLDEAELKLKEAAKRAPDNEKVFYYLTLIEERRYLRDPNTTQTPSTPPAEKPRSSQPANYPNPEAEQSTPQAYYNRLMMERYGVIPKGASPRVFDPRTKQDRGLIVSKLGRIVLDEVMLEGVPLPEVLRFLDEESRKRDPEKKGINFLINPNTTQSTRATVIDPQTGQAITLPPPEPMDMNSVVIRFNLPLRNVRLKDVLDAIVRVADKPIEYSIEEYGLVFSQAANLLTDPAATRAAKSLETAPLQVRTYKMDADKLLPGLKRAFGIGLEGLTSDRSKGGSASPDASVENLRKELESLKNTLKNLLTQFTDESQYVAKVRAQIAAVEQSIKEKVSGEPAEGRQIQTALRQLLTQLGVNMDVPGKAFFYNDLTGIFMVRATTEDLAIVQGAVETLGGVANEQRPQAGSRGEGATLSPIDLMQRRYGGRSAKQ